MEQSTLEQLVQKALKNLGLAACSTIEESLERLVAATKNAQEETCRLAKLVERQTEQLETEARRHEKNLLKVENKAAVRKMMLDNIGKVLLMNGPMEDD